jgi:4-hydroxy-3-polyprenylbenzoate decarboxylase
MQVYDGQTAGMHWQRQKIGAEHYREAIRAAATEPQSGTGHVGTGALARTGRADSARPAVDIMARTSGGSVLAEGDRPSGKMEVAVALGTDPAVTFSAIVPAPPDVEEYLIAGFLRQKPVELVKCETVDLEVPASSEIVLEGHVHLDQLRSEGPFGDHTGFYSLADWYPAFHVTAITHRKNAIYPTTIVGKPPMEDYYLGKATERIFLPLLRMIIPDILDYCLPISGVFHNCCFVKIRKEYPFQARRVMHAIWGAGQMAFTKFIVVVDEHVNVHDEQDVLFHLFSNCDPQRDSEIVHGPVDILDHASPDLGTGSKIGFDATVKLPAEGKVRVWPKELSFDAPTKQLIERRWKEYGL